MTDHAKWCDFSGPKTCDACDGVGYARDYLRAIGAPDGLNECGACRGSGLEWCPGCKRNDAEGNRS